MLYYDVNSSNGQENMKNGSQSSIGAEPTSELSASIFYQNSLPSGSSLVGLSEEDVPGISLNGCEPCLLHVVELMH